MTIALGLRCENGIVLGADTEISGYLAKWQQPKFAQMFWTNEIGTAIVYSGDVDYAQMASEKLRTAILDSKPEYSAILQVIEKTLIKIYKGPIAAHPGPEKPTVSLLLALRLANEPFVTLIKTSETAIITSGQCEFIGAGAELARYIASKVYNPSYTIEECALVVAYILHEVKNNIRGCGGLSTIVAIEPDLLGATRVESIKNLETKFSYPFLLKSFTNSPPLVDKLISSSPSPT